MMSLALEIDDASPSAVADYGDRSRPGGNSAISAESAGSAASDSVEISPIR